MNLVDRRVSRVVSDTQRANISLCSVLCQFFLRERTRHDFCTDIVRKRILSNISRCIDSIIVGPNICQVLFKQDYKIDLKYASISSLYRICKHNDTIVLS